MFNEVIDFKIISVLSLSWEKKQSYAKARPYNALSLRLNGDAVFIHENSSYRVKQNDIIFVPANYDYTIQSNKHEDVIVIHFDILNSQHDEIKILTPSNANIFIDLFNKIYKCWHDKPVGYEYKIYSISYSIFENIEIQAKDVALSSTINLQNVINYINSNFSDSSLSIKDLAKYCNVSTTYFRKMFLKYLSVTPIKYLIDLRIKHATSLLKSGYYSVEETAQRSGYEDVKYFSTIYKKICGISPSKVKDNIEE